MKKNLTDKEIVEDFKRFLRHEAMRANTIQNVVQDLVVDYLKEKTI